jgi:hypothetical protein
MALSALLVPMGMAFSQGTWVPVFNGIDASGIKTVAKGALSLKDGVAKGDCCDRLPSGIELNINDAGIKDIWWMRKGPKGLASGTLRAGKVYTLNGRADRAH